MPTLSIIAQYDDLCRYGQALQMGCEKEFIEYLEGQKGLVQELKEARANIEDLKVKNETLEAEKKKNDCQILHLRNLIELEGKKRKVLENEKNSMAAQLAVIKEVLLTNEHTIDGTTKAKLGFLSNTVYKQHFAESEVKTTDDSTGCLLSLSDIDYTCASLHLSTSGRRKRPSNRSSRSSGCKVQKKKKSKEHVAFRLDEAEEEFRVESSDAYQDIGPGLHCGSETNSSSPISHSPQEFESDSEQVKSSPYNLRSHSSPTLTSSTPLQESNSIKTHSFAPKTGILPERCCTCGKVVVYQALKCIDCKTTCHKNCKERCPLPCNPTPSKVSTIKQRMLRQSVDSSQVSPIAEAQHSLVETPIITPVRVRSRLGPIYSTVQRSRRDKMRSPDRIVRSHSTNKKGYFLSPLLK